ncbi:MAG: PilZ domain-containing protein [Polyangiaceae bacterium]
MSDPASTARSARENLSKGLNALQTDPNLPPQLMELASPIAQAMGALHKIEKSNGAELLPHANIALENVRKALAELQAAPPNLPAVGTAMEAVASSLALVHALSKLAGPAQSQQQTAQPPQVAPAAPPPQANPLPVPQPQPAQPQQPRTQPVAQQPQLAPQPGTQQASYSAPVATFPPPQQQAQQYQPQQAPQYQGQQQQASQYQAQAHQPQAPQQQLQPAAPAPAYVPPPQPAQAQYAADPFATPRAPAQPAPGPIASPPANGDVQVYSADLGAQSPTNFYKGLSGNDIIDHGGLFISTYKVPKIGTPVRLHISLPGGYEFEANAVVRWSRESSDAGDSAPPGFGAQLTAITPEARQLVYRYVRNREPLFHDDL